MDFKDITKNKNRFDAMLVIVDRLSKQVVIIPCFQTIISYDLASIFITNIYRYYSILLTIISNRNLQFIS
jgi:hypothetical protein